MAIAGVMPMRVGASEEGGYRPTKDTTLISKGFLADCRHTEKGSLSGRASQNFFSFLWELITFVVPSRRDRGTIQPTTKKGTDGGTPCAAVDVVQAHVRPIGACTRA